MRRRMVFFLWCLLVGALAACGQARPAPLPTAITPAPTATATAIPTAIPTATPLPTPTVTSTAPPPTATPTRTPAPTATATPTARPVSVTPTTTPPYTIRDSSGLCAATVPGAFRDDGGIWRVGDEAGVTLAGLPTGGALDFDTVTQLLVGNIGSQIGDYRETGRMREGSDRLRITYTGRVFGVPGGGTIYQRQFGPTMCALVLFAAEGQGPRYVAPFEGIIASLAPAR